MRRLLPALGFVLACSRTPSSNEGVVLQPPPPPPAASTASAAPRPVAPPVELALIGGTLVDVEAAAPLRELTTDMVLTQAVGFGVAYAWARPAAGGQELRAYDTTTGALKWAKPAVSCWELVATSHGVFCGDESGVRLFDAATGAPTVLGGATAVASLFELGGRVIVLRRDKRFEVFTDAGAPVGNLTVPVMPDGGYSRSALALAGALACGVQRSDVAATAFCVDATPRIVWQRAVTIPGGLLVQADAGALVVASDTWTKTGIASEVIRPSDGSTLLRVPSVRLAAALTTGGVLDGALSVAPDITWFDAKGTAKWTAHPPPFHDEAARAVRLGPNLAVAIYSPIATGVELLGFDAATGALAWTGNVDSLPIGHSKYSNQVELRLGSGGGLLLRGHESGQDHVQTFDAHGVRRASVVRRR